MRILWVVALSGALGVFGCSDSSDNGGTGGTAGSGGMAGTGGDMGTGGTAGDTGGGGTGGSAGADGTGGVGGAMAPSALFCESYESTCGFGADRYADADDCITSYEGYVVARQTCVEMHLGFAEGGDIGLHCPHATGEAPCN